MSMTKHFFIGLLLALATLVAGAKGVYAQSSDLDLGTTRDTLNVVLYFGYGNSELASAVTGNASGWHRLAEGIAAEGDSTSIRRVRIYVRVSPDGTIVINNRIARERIKSVKKFLVDSCGMASAKVFTMTERIDKDWVSTLVEKSEIPYSFEVMKKAAPYNVCQVKPERKPIRKPVSQSVSKPVEQPVEPAEQPVEPIESFSKSATYCYFLPTIKRVNLNFGLGFVRAGHENTELIDAYCVKSGEDTWIWII